MKMNKMFKVLVAGAMLVLAVGCEEAKEVENINIQDTNPVVEEKVEDLGVCEFCGDTTLTGDKFNELVQASYDSLAKLDMNKEDEREKYFYRKRTLECQIKYNGCTDCAMVEDFLLECHNVGLKMPGEWVDEHLEICNATHTNVENLPTEEPKVEEKVEVPVVKEEPKKETCPMCLAEGDVDNMVRMGEAYYHQGCYEEPVASAKADEYCYYCDTDEHNGDECEGATWAEQGLETPNAEATNCDACGTANIEVMDSAGGYICNECGHCN